MNAQKQGVHRLRIFDVTYRNGKVTLEDRGITTDRPAEVSRVRSTPGTDAVMLWDTALELPQTALLQRLLRGSCHVWHGGLALGQAGRPTAWDITQGRAMLSVDAEPGIESTSWRVSLRALLVRNEVLDQLGGFDPGFDTGSGSALDAGLRWSRHGALIRHVPALLEATADPSPDAPPTERDGLRIVRRRLGTGWAAWAAYRSVRNRTIALGGLRTAFQTLREPIPSAPAVLGLSTRDGPSADTATVTVLLPTVGRYPFLEVVLRQLSTQTRPPDEVVIVDQNPEDEWRDLQALVPSLPLKILHLHPPGQCTARNMGLRQSTGSHILFLDDDDEIPNDLIEQHLKVLSAEEVSVSCGLVDDAETGPAPVSLRFRRIGDTFPTNNAMIRRTVLETAGLFDPTYDRGARADHDLGMRSYLAGNLHVYDPRPSVFHHHAPMGGLRTHGARVHTRGNSRSTARHRHLRTPTDFYLGLRYHTDFQIREDTKRSMVSTLRGSGSRLQRAARVLVQVALLPDTRSKTRAARREGQALYDNRPPLPRLDEPS